MGNKKLSIFAALFSMVLGVAGVQAQIWNPRPNDNQIRNILNRLETRTDTFRGQVDNRLDNSRWDNTRRENQIMDFVNAFENSTDQLRRSFGDRRVTQSEVNQVLTYGAYIDDFMRRNQLAAAPERQWNLIRTDLNQLANRFGVRWNWNQNLPPFPGTGGGFPGGGFYQPNENQVRTLLTRLETRTNTFSTAVKRRFDNNNRWDNTRRDDQIEPYINAFENATDVLRRSFNDRRVTENELTQVLNNGWYVNDFMRKTAMTNNVERQWTQIRTDLDQLARLYRVNWSWNQQLPPFQNDPWGNDRNSRLDGTYRLNVGRSDNVNNVINRSVSNTNTRNRQRQNLTRRLTAPQALAIEVRGNQVTMATDFGAPVTLTADGRTITETNNRGRTTRTTVSMTGNTLTIVTDGDRNQDFRVTFAADGSNRLRVTRQIYLENQNQMISATSVYDRTSNVATWPNVDPNRPGWNDPVTGNFYIPNGTRLTAVLRNRIATNVSQAGDRFTMEVTSPNQYSGAIITGRIAEAEGSGRVSGRANLTMEFDSIQYRGRTYSFAGIIDSAREADGDTINISNEGTVRDGNQTTRTVTRAGIGAALGAIIGAIASGGDGAAIGAAIGAGAGAGTVLIQGRDNLQLEAGTQFMITATGPTNVGYRN